MKEKNKIIKFRKKYVIFAIGIMGITLNICVGQMYTFGLLMKINSYIRFWFVINIAVFFLPFLIAAFARAWHTSVGLAVPSSGTHNAP